MLSDARVCRRLTGAREWPGVFRRRHALDGFHSTCRMGVLVWLAPAHGGCFLVREGGKG